MLYNCVINIQKIGYNIGINYTSPYYIERITYIMQKVDIKAIVKNLNKEELRDLISVAQGVLSALFSSDEIKDNIKMCIRDRIGIVVKFKNVRCVYD